MQDDRKTFAKHLIGRRTFLKGSAAAGALAAIPGALLSSSARAASGTLNIQQSMATQEARDFMQALATEFQDANPGVTVNVAYVPWENHRTVVLSRFSAGNLPDIIHSASTQGSVEFTNLGAFIDLGPMMPSAFKDNFVPAAFEEIGTYGLPSVQSPESSVFYRRDMFEAAGVKPPPTNEAWSWDEMTAAAQKLTKGDQFGFVERGKAGFIMQKSMIPYPWSYGTDIIVKKDGKWQSTFGTQPMANAIQMNVDLLNKYHVRPASYLNWGLPEAQRAWAGDQMAMFTSGMWWAANVESNTAQRFGKDFDVMLFPVADPANKAVQTTFDYFHVSKDSADPQLAMQFLQFMFAKQRLVALAKTEFNLIPTTLDALAEPYYSAENFPLWGARYGKWLDYSRFLPNHPKYNALWINIVEPVVQAMVSQLQSVPDGLAEIDKRINAELAAP